MKLVVVKLCQSYWDLQLLRLHQGGYGGHEAPLWCHVSCFMVRWPLSIIFGTLRVACLGLMLVGTCIVWLQPTRLELSVAHLEAVQRLWSMIVITSTATLVPGYGNRIIRNKERARFNLPGGESAIHLFDHLRLLREGRLGSKFRN